MKKGIIIGILLSSILLVSSCVEEDMYKHKKIGEDVYRNVELNLGGELSMIETPLGVKARSSELKNEIYGIGIYQFFPTTNGKFTLKPYAYGFFDDCSTMSVGLLEGYKYRVLCTMIADAKDSLLIDDKLDRPFILDRVGEVPGYITNKFVISENQYGGIVFPYELENTRFGTEWQRDYSRPFLKRYYGKIDTLYVQDEPQTLELYRKYFAVNFEVKGLAKGRSLRIELANSPAIYLSENRPSSGDVYVSLSFVNAAITPGKIYTENCKVTITMMEDGKEDQIIYERNNTFKRNHLHKITLLDLDNLSTRGEIGLDIESGELLDGGNTDIIW